MSKFLNVIQQMLRFFKACPRLLHSTTSQNVGQYVARTSLGYNQVPLQIGKCLWIGSVYWQPNCHPLNSNETSNESCHLACKMKLTVLLNTCANDRQESNLQPSMAVQDKCLTNPNKCRLWPHGGDVALSTKTGSLSGVENDANDVPIINLERMLEVVFAFPLLVLLKSRSCLSPQSIVES